ncbi:glycoside hydrolase family 16 protein [Gonapodya prolifera JEL478]|uniref:Glycoside hydrolase family 16 protein n=1 Tax=Gonapodya prolifera (strain JEL478) TaxID=1344416 RepID=A0A139ANE8_GONPJ|nr:glycoside hydrolase family 16 protein [Gonapodya prolifera JEL478]|eukprot:KXS18270.1 glycoside hydrolase family 16 protein [Gonapodya prolifera JEL478]
MRLYASSSVGLTLGIIALLVALFTSTVVGQQQQQANRKPLNHQTIYGDDIKPPCANYTENFDDPSKLINWQDWFNLPDRQVWIMEDFPNANITNNELVLKLLGNGISATTGKQEGLNVIVAFSRWFHYGRVSATMKVAKGPGVVSAFIVDSYTPSASPGDELDQEWTGQSTNIYQTNWFGLGKLNYPTGAPAASQHYGNGASFTASGGSDYHDQYHTFSMERTHDYIRWFVDGVQVRQVLRSDTGDADYPDRLGAVLFNIWDAGQQAPGTVEWAGGATDWSINPNPNYEVHVKQFQIVCYDSPGNWTAPTMTLSGTALPRRTTSLANGVRTVPINGTWWFAPTSPAEAAGSYVPYTTAAAATGAAGIGLVTGAPVVTRTATATADPGSLNAAIDQQNATASNGVIAGLSLPAVIGIAGGALALIVLVAGALIYRRRRSRRYQPARTASQRRWAQTIASLDPAPNRWGAPLVEDEIGLRDADEHFAIGRPSRDSMTSVDVDGRPSDVGRTSMGGRPSIGGRGEEREGLVGGRR